MSGAFIDDPLLQAAFPDTLCPPKVGCTFQVFSEQSKIFPVMPSSPYSFGHILWLLPQLKYKLHEGKNSFCCRKKPWEL